MTFHLQQPIIVKLIDPPRDPTGLADVLLGALGLTGVIVVIAVVLGIVLAGVMFWMRSRSTGGAEIDGPTPAVKIKPGPYRFLRRFVRQA